MMKVDAKPKNRDEAADALGEAGETEFTFLLMPVTTYSVIAEQARNEGISVGEVLQKAVLKYLLAANGVDPEPKDSNKAMPEPDMVIRRRR